MPGPHLTPFQAIGEYVRAEIRQASERLSAGQWDGEIAGRELVARIHALNDVYERMRKITTNTDDLDEEEIG